MKNLGRYYFFENNYEKSIECFENSLKLNKLYPDTWFTMGCAQMKIEDFKGAVFSFATVVSIDDHKYEAWANLANCYIAQKKFF